MNFNSEVASAVSEARLSTYRALVSSDEGAWRLYRWNIELAASVAPLISDAEVALRNTIHNRLFERFGREDWWAEPTLLFDDDTAEKLGLVVKRYRKRIEAGAVGPGKVVAGTTLGVWVNLLSRGGHDSLGRAVNYEERLWRPALRFGFSLGTFTKSGRERRPKRDDVHSRAELLQLLRNRVAHHEPIFEGVRRSGTGESIPLFEAWDGTVELLEWMCPGLADWHRSERRMLNVLQQRPAV